MKKLFKFIAILLSFTLIVVGCVIANNIYEKKKFADAEYEMVVSESASVWHPDVEEIKSVEDKSLLKEKEEFMQLFKRFCGFSLPEYFIIPKITEDTPRYSVSIDERFMIVSGWFIFKKNDALEVLNYLRKDDGWSAFSQGIGLQIKTPKAREICNCFRKSYKHYESLDCGDYSSVCLDFIYDEENDFYFVNLLATLERDPPPGTSWPELNFH